LLSHEIAIASLFNIWGQPIDPLRRLRRDPALREAIEKLGVSLD
jgi:hypothetical protein